MTVRTAATEATAAAAAAAGSRAGGYDSVADAARVLARVKDTIYEPDPADAAAYERLYGVYKEIAAVFDPAGNSALQTLRRMKETQG